MGRGVGNRQRTVNDDRRDAERAVRRRRVWDLRLEGKSFPKIAEELGVSVGTAFNDWERARTEVPQETIEQRRALANALLDTDDARLDGIIRKFEGKAREGDQEAARTVARLVEKRVAIATRRAKLNGEDAPERVELGGPGGGPIKTSSPHDDLLGRLARIAATIGAGTGDPKPDGGGG